MIYLHVINNSANIYFNTPEEGVLPDGWVEVAQEVYDTWLANPDGYTWQADGALKEVEAEL